MSTFTTPLYLIVHDVPLKQKPFELTYDFMYYTKIGCAPFTERLIMVPRGYRTDFASIPRFLWRILPPFGPYGKAAVVHDWLCDESPHSVDHITAAEIFNEGMTVLGVGRFKRWTMTQAVKRFGPKFERGRV